MLTDSDREIELLQALARDQAERANGFRDGWAECEGRYREDMKRLRRTILNLGRCRLCLGLTYSTDPEIPGSRSTCGRCDGTGLETEAHLAVYKGLTSGQVVMPDGSVGGSRA